MTTLSSPLHAVVALFSGPLEGVRFADIDADNLGNLAADVETTGGEVEALEVQLASLREVLAQKQEALLMLAQQALAYARIYAESDEVLTAQLDEIALPRATKLRKTGAIKSPSERSARAPKELADSGDRGSVEVEVPEVEVPEVEAPVVALAKPKRKAAPIVEPEEKTAVSAPAKSGRRKLPTRGGRASR